jgi:hypothetical protein
VILSHSQDKVYLEEENQIIIQTGNDLEYVWELEIDDDNNFKSFKFIHLNTDFIEDKSLKDYIDRFFTSNEHQIKSNTYSKEKCASCHLEIYKKWKYSKHSEAFSTLISAKKEKDSECISCHSTEIKQYSRLKSQIENVHCIACHNGAQLPHEKGFTKLLIKPTKKTCVTCHTAKNSPHFQLKSYMEMLMQIDLLFLLRTFR